MERSGRRNQALQHIEARLNKISSDLEKTKIADYVQLLNSPVKLIVTNLLAGISRGVGIAIGFSVFTTLIVYALRAVGALDLPVIGDFIADVVRHTQDSLNRGLY